MVYMLVVSFSWGIAFIGPANFDTYDQCKYHAEKVETLRLRHSMGRPSITATCKQVLESK